MKTVREYLIELGHKVPEKIDISHHKIFPSKQDSFNQCVDNGFNDAMNLIEPLLDAPMPEGLDEEKVKSIIRNEITWLNHNVFSKTEVIQLHTAKVLEGYISRAICQRFSAGQPVERCPCPFCGGNGVDKFVNDGTGKFVRVSPPQSVNQKLREALEKIKDIKLRPGSRLWAEIEEAKNIAKEALASTDEPNEPEWPQIKPCPKHGFELDEPHCQICYEMIIENKMRAACIAAWKKANGRELK